MTSDTLVGVRKWHASLFGQAKAWAKSCHRRGLEAKLRSRDFATRLFFGLLTGAPWSPWHLLLCTHYEYNVTNNRRHFYTITWPAGGTLIGTFRKVYFREITLPVEKPTCEVSHKLQAYERENVIGSYNKQ